MRPATRSPHGSRPNTKGPVKLVLLASILLAGAATAQVTGSWHRGTIAWRSGHESSALHDVTFGHGRFVAIGSAHGTSGVIVASADGITWQDVTPGTPARLEALGTWPQGFVAMGRDGVVAMSPDGLAWTVSHFPELDRCPMDDIVWTGSRLVAVGTDLDGNTFMGLGCVAWSFDGHSWSSDDGTQGVAQVLGPLHGAAWTDRGVVAVGFAANTEHTAYHGIVLNSKTGLLGWLSCPRPDGAPMDVASNGGQLLVAGPVLNSELVPDGTAFQTSRGACDFWRIKRHSRRTLGNVNGVLWAGTSWLAFGPGVFSSLDGLTFSPEVTEIEGQPLDELKAGALKEGTLVAVGPSGIIHGTLQPTPPLGDPGLSLRVVPTAAHASGVAGVQWTTDLVLRNFGTEPVHATVYFQQTGLDNTTAEARPVVVPPGASCDATDVVLSSFLQGNAAGALAVQSDGPLVIGSETTATREWHSGQHVPALPGEAALSTGEEARLIGLARSAAFRTNLGLVSIGPSTTSVDVEAHDATGTLLRTVTYTLLPYGHLQVTDLFAKLEVSRIEDAWVLIRPTSPGARLLTYASVIDNRTGDPSLVLPLQAVSTEPLYLPGAAHAPGVGGTLWRTDLEVHNPGTSEASYLIELLPALQDNSSPQGRIFTLGPGASTRFSDVLDTTFAYTGSAALRVTPVKGSVSAWARTYNQTWHGAFGQLISGLPLSEATPPEGGWRLAGLAECGTYTPRIRTNLGIVNPTASPLSVEVILGHGDEHGDLGPPVVRVDLPPYGFVPVNRPFVASETCTDFWAVVRPVGGAAPLLTYASVIDSRDAAYIPGE